MATFTLDTSGVVSRPSENGLIYPTEWSDLSPFAQGYVEALFARLSVDLWAARVARDDRGPPARDPGFSDLDPAALALILRDCARREAQHKPDITRPIVGKMFWNHRQHGVLGAEFPPLAVYLSDASKVCLRESG